MAARSSLTVAQCQRETDTHGGGEGDKGGGGLQLVCGGGG